MSALTDMLKQLQRIEQHRTQAQAEGIPALRRLAKVARRDSGQARTVGLFLLALYNGNAYPLNLSRLRGLDLDLHNDCMAVLQLDFQPVMEVHQYLEDGDTLFGQLVSTLVDAGGAK